MQDQHTKPRRANKFEWHRAFMASSLTITQKVVGVRVWDYVGADGTNGFPGRAALARDLGVSQKTVGRALVACRAAGWLTRTSEGRSCPRRDWSDVYALAYPVDAHVEQAEEPAAISGTTPEIAEPVSGTTPEMNTDQGTPVSLCPNGHGDTSVPRSTRPGDTSVPMSPRPGDTSVPPIDPVFSDPEEITDPSPSTPEIDAPETEHAEQDAPPTADADNPIADFLAAIDTTDAEVVEEPEPAPTADTQTAALFNLPTLDAEVVDDEPTAPTKPPTTPEQQATTAAYERTGKAFNFVAVRGIAKWAIHDRGATTDAVENAIVGVYELGRPVMKSTVGQWLDGIIGPAGTRPGGISKQDAKILSYLETGRRLSAQRAANQAHHTPALAPAPTTPDSIF